MEADLRDLWPRWAPIAAAIPAVCLAALTPVVHSEGRGPLLYGLLLMATLPWLVEAAGRRLGPWWFAGLALAPLAVINWGGHAIGLDMSHDAQLSLMLVLWAVGCIAATSAPRISGPIIALGLLIPFGRYLLHGFDAWPFWMAGTVFAAITGLLMHGQQDLVQQLRTAQAALAAEAAKQERARIAREVHDVIAHHLTVTMLHVTGARMALHRDRGDAEEALAEAERLGRQALADIRHTVGLLHDEPGGGTAAALPQARDLPALIAAYEGAGVAVDLDCRTDLASLSPAASLAVYRSVQEALANAAKHAPGAPITVSISEADGELLVEVADGGTTQGGNGDGGGLGLLGMRQRIEALGGTVTAGPNGAGWTVACAIPLRGAKP
jgi:signal transduction histidine kinase